MAYDKDEGEAHTHQSRKSSWELMILVPFSGCSSSSTEREVATIAAWSAVSNLTLSLLHQDEERGGSAQPVDVSTSRGHQQATHIPAHTHAVKGIAGDAAPAAPAPPEAMPLLMKAAAVNYAALVQNQTNSTMDKVSNKAIRQGYHTKEWWEDGV